MRHISSSAWQVTGRVFIIDVDKWILTILLACKMLSEYLMI